MARETDVIFGFAPFERNDGATLLLGITRECYAGMQDGKTQTLDLTKVGIPIKLIVFGSPDRETAMKWITAGATEAGAELLINRFDANLSIDVVSGYDPTAPLPPREDSDGK